MHGWTNFTLQSIELTGRSEVFHITIWFVVVALIIAIWGAETLRKDGEMPHPPQAKRETTSEGGDRDDDEVASVSVGVSHPSELTDQNRSCIYRFDWPLSE